MKTKQLTKEEFETLVSASDMGAEEWHFLGKRPCIVDFYAEWCGPCKMLSPVLEELAAYYGDKIDVYKVNTEKEQALSTRFRVRTIPTLMFCPMQERPRFKLGAMSLGHLKEAVDRELLTSEKQINSVP